MDYYKFMFWNYPGINGRLEVWLTPCPPLKFIHVLNWVKVELECKYKIQLKDLTVFATGGRFYDSNHIPFEKTKIKSRHMWKTSKYIYEKYCRSNEFVVAHRSNSGYSNVPKSLIFLLKIVMTKKRKLKYKMISEQSVNEIDLMLKRFRFLEQEQVQIYRDLAKTALNFAVLSMDIELIHQAADKYNNVFNYCYQRYNRQYIYDTTVIKDQKFWEPIEERRKKKKRRIPS